ncbi:MAG: hypothetical protein ACI4NN_08800 [Pyramidobacter sp.]
MTRMQSILDAYGHEVPAADCSSEIPEFNLYKYLLPSDLERKAVIDPDHGIYGGFFKRLVKRVVRKSIRFYVDPCLSDVSSFNTDVAVTVKCMQKEIEACRAELLRCRQEIEDLRKKAL